MCLCTNKTRAVLIRQINRTERRETHIKEAKMCTFLEATAKNFHFFKINEYSSVKFILSCKFSVIRSKLHHLIFITSVIINWQVIFNSFYRKRFVYKNTYMQTTIDRNYFSSRDIGYVLLTRDAEDFINQRL